MVDKMERPQMGILERTKLFFREVGEEYVLKYKLISQSTENNLIQRRKEKCREKEDQDDHAE